MARLTYYVALPFLKAENGDIIAGEPREARDGGQAARYAGIMASGAPNCGAVAFSRSGDPKLGDFDEAEVIKVFGEVDTAVVG